MLTPAVPSRLESIAKLMAEVERQRGDLPVEHLVLLDNKARTVGEKRQALLEAARGAFVAFVDDDDWIRPRYVAAIVEAIIHAKHPVEVVTFEQMASFDGVEGKVVFRACNPNEEWKAGGITSRAAWHVCAWNRETALRSRFPAKNWGEDWEWAAPLNEMCIPEIHIPEILHEYRYTTSGSEAHP